MAEKQWTEQQQDAINARGGTVLVSAAAGSGKTAVLVERVIHRILDKNNPIDADRLLVVTFSNAAALEMKQRIMARVNALLCENPNDALLKRQQLLLTRAHISTIHAFCLDLIRSNFQQLGISSNIRTADEKELDILRMDCAQESVERYYQKDTNGEFGHLIELLRSGRDDRAVFTTLFRLYDFVRSHPFYLNWLDQTMGFYGKGIKVTDSIWGKCILNYAKDALRFAKELTSKSLKLISEDEKMSKAYYEPVSYDLTQIKKIEELVDTHNWDGICQSLARFKFDRLGSVRGDNPNKDTVMLLRKQVKTLINTLCQKQFCATENEFKEDMDFLRPLVNLLFDLVKDFDHTFTQAKQQRNLMDFSDMEHYAIKLLVLPAGSGYEPTLLAKSSSELFDEVLIDEFQDTNAAQDMIFRAISHHEQNLFMVGDVKQSIYRFRQAMPELFMEKKKTFTTYDGHNYPAKIILGKNFRSAHEITEGINFFFNLLMSEKIGEVNYNKEEALIAGTIFPEKENRGCAIKALDLTDYNGERDKTTIEADYVAAQIAKMLKEQKQIVENGKLRTIRPSDICILLRSPASKTQNFVNALNKQKVPVWAEPKNGFLTTKEIAPVVALLRVISNPLKDIDLAATMMSALFGFTADEMAAIRIEQKKGALYTAVCKYAEKGDKHASEFLTVLRALRQYSSGSTADEIIRKIYDKTDYTGKVQAMHRGQVRRSNLLLLVQYACDYHKNGYKGLYGFLTFLDRLLERGSDLAAASTLSEQADVVRIMSIHRSKGLEFPVVFLCDCSKQFNKEDLKSNTLLHSELGFACMRRDFKKMIQYTTIPMQALKLEIERSMLSEELRILYVALTRAKEHLYLVGTIKKVQKKLTTLISELGEERKLSSYFVRGATSYMDWILMAALHHHSMSETIAGYDFETEIINTSVPLRFDIVPITDEAQCNNEMENLELENVNQLFLSQLKNRLEFQYPYQAQTKIPTKIAVSQIAKADATKNYRFVKQPAFLQKSGLTGAQKGNAMHKFMQFADYHLAAKDINQEINSMVKKQYLSKQEAEALSANRLECFFSSPLAQRIFASKKVWRELKFLSETGKEVLGVYTELFEHGGKTAIQGVADCVFVEDGSAVIVDYKTDHVKSPKELVERYHIQLELYKKVLTQSLGIPVKECVLYSFALSQAIHIN